MRFLILILISIVPHDDVYRDSVDLVELNHFYDEHGRLVFDQLIWYDWMPFEKETESEAETEGTHRVVAVVPAGKGWRYQVRAWRLIKNLNMMPVRDWERGGYTSFWCDGEQTREVKAKAFRETWTQYDPELVEREFLPKEKRKELKMAKVKYDRPSGAIRPVIEDDLVPGP